MGDVKVLEFFLDYGAYSVFKGQLKPRGRHSGTAFLERKATGSGGQKRKRTAMRKHDGTNSVAGECRGFSNIARSAILTKRFRSEASLEPSGPLNFGRPTQHW